MNEYKTIWDNAAKGDWRNAILTGADSDSFKKTGQTDANLILKTFQDRMGRNAESVLDFGCGAGRILVPMLDKVREGYGIDVSPGMLEICKNRARMVADKLHTLVHGRDNIGSLGVDLAYSWLCLQHMEYAHAYQALCTIYSALKPGGMFMATFPNAHSDAYWPCIDTFRTKTYPFSAAHVRVYVPEMVCLFLTNAGFTILEVRGDAAASKTTVSSAEILAIAQKPE